MLVGASTGFELVEGLLYPASLSRARHGRSHKPVARRHLENPRRFNVSYHIRYPHLALGWPLSSTGSSNSGGPKVLMGSAPGIDVHNVVVCERKAHAGDEIGPDDAR